jgi:hypothetical protein
MSILNPIAAALSGLVIVLLCRQLPINALRRKQRIIFCVCLILINAIIGQIALRNYFEDGYIREYRLGKVIASLSDPGDLMISLGLEPITIYYSGLYGWVFPPAEYWADEKLYYDSNERILMLNKLREEGAEWLSIPNGSFDREKEPILSDYLNESCILMEYKSSGTICNFR